MTEPTIAVPEAATVAQPVPSFSLRRGDAVESMRLLADESIDLIVTDPAYESLEKHRSVGTTTRLKQSKSSSNKWFQIFPNARFPELFEEMYRVLRRDRHLYILCDQETAFIIKPMGEAVGFRFWKPLIWDKVTMGMGYHYRARYEMILFFEKGKRKLNDLGIDDILEAKRVRDGYPTEKPTSILTTLITQSTAASTWPTTEQPPEIVLDPFMGSGSTAESAIRTGRRFVGCDLEQDAVDLTRSRLEGICGPSAPFDPFAPRARPPGQLVLDVQEQPAATLPTITRTPLSPPETFGETIRDTRVRAGFSLRELAARLDVSPSYLSDIELDHRTPSVEVAEALAAVLVLDAEDLIARSGRLSDETERYMLEHPTAGALLRLLASLRLSDEQLQVLLDQVERMGQPPSS